jgi:hypothetical protein
MATLPTIRSYGNYSSDNYGAHALVVDVGPVRVWYSYTTPVAFQVDGRARVVRENDWGPTTGKHLNWIDVGDKDAKKARVSSADFETAWRDQVEAASIPMG